MSDIRIIVGAAIVSGVLGGGLGGWINNTLIPGSHKQSIPGPKSHITTDLPPDLLHSEGDTTTNVGIIASRTFAGPNQYPPTDFAAYGIVAFPSRAAGKDDLSRHKMICSAYVARLPDVSEAQAQAHVAIKSQMVTVWPIESDHEADRINDMPRDKICPDAVSHYGLVRSTKAIADARASNAAFDGDGPFLLAWSPAEKQGDRDALVLVSNLSDVTTTEQAREIFNRWATDIQENPELWDKGWNSEKLKITIRLWTDKYGPKVLSVFQGKDKAKKGDG